MRRVMLCLTAVALLALPNAVVGQEETAPASKAKQRFIDPAATVRGIFYGRVWHIHPDYLSIQVMPFDEETPAHTFLLDKRTRVRLDGDRASREDLEIGDYVAVRYFGEKELRLIDTVFIVLGEFEPADYEKKPRKRKR